MPAVKKPASKKQRKKNRRRCECGALAAYRMRVVMLEPDLSNEHQAHLLLCQACYELEVESCRLNGQKVLPVQRVR